VEKVKTLLTIDLVVTLPQPYKILQ